MFENDDHKVSKQECHEMVKHPTKLVKTRQQTSQLSEVDPQTVRIEISEPEVSKGGIFSFSYLSFRVASEPMGWEVRRLEKDFVTLRQYLVKQFPTVLVRQ